MHDASRACCKQTFAWLRAVTHTRGSKRRPAASAAAPPWLHASCLQPCCFFRFAAAAACCAACIACQSGCSPAPAAATAAAVPASPPPAAAAPADCMAGCCCRCPAARRASRWHACVLVRAAPTLPLGCTGFESAAAVGAVAKFERIPAVGCTAAVPTLKCRYRMCCNQCPGPDSSGPHSMQVRHAAFGPLAATGLPDPCHARPQGPSAQLRRHSSAGW